MLKKIDLRYVLVFGVLLIMVLAPGCTEKAEPEAVVEEVTEAVEETAAAAEEMGEEQMTLVADKLAAIDEMDGTVDNIISKCAGCALQMDGVEDHRLDVAGYQLHFCSAECIEHMGEEPAAAILALVVPE